LGFSGGTTHCPARFKTGVFLGERLRGTHTVPVRPALLFNEGKRRGSRLIGQLTSAKLILKNHY
jgi:hypothetical protein